MSSAIFHPLPTSCAPATASHNPFTGSHPSQTRRRWRSGSSLVASPPCSSHSKNPRFPLQHSYHDHHHDHHHPAGTCPIFPGSSLRLPSRRHPDFFFSCSSSSRKGHFFSRPYGCTPGDGGGSILGCCTRPPASGCTFPFGAPDEATVWGSRAAVSPPRREHPAPLAAAAGRPSSSKKEDKLVTEGLITELLPNCMFRVRLDNGEVILGYVSGKMRTKMVRVLVGDRVRIEVSRYDSSRGRIVYRLRSKSSTD